MAEASGKQPVSHFPQVIEIRGSAATAAMGELPNSCFFRGKGLIGFKADDQLPSKRFGR